MDGALTAETLIRRGPVGLGRPTDELTPIVLKKGGELQFQPREYGGRFSRPRSLYWAEHCPLKISHPLKILEGDFRLDLRLD